VQKFDKIGLAKLKLSW